MARTSALIFATTSGGRRPGPNRPNHDTAVKPGTVSAIAGTSGSSAMRFSAPSPMIFTVSALACGIALPVEMNINWMWPAMTSSRAGVAPL